MSLRELLLGRPLRSEEERQQQIGPLRGVSLLGLDALASAAYGPEAALTVLLSTGALATAYVGPISAVIIALLIIVATSYHQTIAAYPNGGGSYTVASENLGRFPGLLAASALSLDYVLNVAVAISAGVGAIVSAAPVLLPYTLWLCLAILVILTLINLRGVREAGLIFLCPTYAFVACLGVTIILGVIKSALAGGHPVPVVRPPIPVKATAAVSAWLLLRAFASGCTAMTGVEAVSNATPIFTPPRVKHAERTLTIIIAILVALLAGIAYLSFAYGIAATPPARAGYQSVLSQLIAAVTGRGWFYYLALASVVTILCLSANTSFADFPRLCRVLALDEFLPVEFAHPGRRLVYSAGIVLLTAFAAALLIAFGGVTDRLIPLFAVGAFLAFTLSQAGMVVHWRRKGGRHSIHARIINTVGAVATGTTVIVVIISKFTDGAWITVLIIPAFVVFFSRVRAKAERVDREVEERGPLTLDHPQPPIVVIPLKRLDRVAHKALRLGVTISPEVHVVQILRQDPDVKDLRGEWGPLVQQPTQEAGFAPPQLVVLRSAYREFFGPLLKYVRQLAHTHPHRYIAVVVPELVDQRWYHLLIHNHRPTLLKGLLLLRGGPQVIVINTPWYLRGDGS